MRKAGAKILFPEGKTDRKRERKEGRKEGRKEQADKTHRHTDTQTESNKTAQASCLEYHALSLSLVSPGPSLDTKGRNMRGK
jgi:hypothetical protein